VAGEKVFSKESSSFARSNKNLPLTLDSGLKNVTPGNRLVELSAKLEQANKTTYKTKTVENFILGFEICKICGA
jgi:hypothetical protein